MALQSLRILVRFDFPTSTFRFWDGAGPYLDAAGDIWSGAVLTEGLDAIESALNAEASTLTLGVSGVDERMMELAFSDLYSGDVIGSKVTIALQPCNEFDEPEGPPETRFVGYIDNMPSEERLGDGLVPVRRIMVEVPNRFTLRRLSSGAVLSDTDQKARSAALNPTGNPDRFCERVAGLADKSIWWPRFT